MKYNVVSVLHIYVILYFSVHSTQRERLTWKIFKTSLYAEVHKSQALGQRGQ